MVKFWLDNESCLGLIINLLKFTGLILSNIRVLRVYAKCANIFFTAFIITQAVELYFVRNDAEMIFTNLKMLVTGIICVVKISTFIYCQEKCLKIIEYIKKIDKYASEREDIELLNIIRKYRNYSKIFTYLYLTLGVMVTTSLVSIPLIFYLASNDKEAIETGEKLLPHIMSSWLPFDKTKGTGYWASVMLHSYVIIAAGNGAIAFDLFSVNAMIYFAAMIDFIKNGCQNMFGDNAKMLSAADTRKIFKRFHEDHDELCKYAALFDSISSPIMLSYLLLCSTVLCLSTYIITVTENFSEKLFAITFPVFCTTQLFVSCWHSHTVMAKSHELTGCAYKSDWYSLDAKHRKGFLLLHGKLDKEICFNAGPFAKINLNMFVSILKGAYSYYTLIKD